MIESLFQNQSKLFVLIVSMSGTLFAAVARGADSNERKIQEGIAEAQAAGQLDEAEALLDQAVATLGGPGLPDGSQQMRLLQADLRRARGQIIANFLKFQPESQELRQRAADSLNKALIEYMSLRTGAEKQVGTLMQKLRPEKRRESTTYQDASALASRSIYSIGWTQYLLSKIESNPGTAQEHLLQAISHFRELTSDGYQSNPIIIDCFVGEATCHLDLNEPHLAVKLLAPATAANTSVDAFKRVTMLRIKALAEVQLYYQIVQSVSAYFALRDSDQEWDAGDLGLALERVVALAHLSELESDRWAGDLYFPYFVESRDELYEHGQPWIDRLIQKLGDEIDGGGYRLLVEARRQFSREQFKIASEIARTGLDEAKGGGDQFVHRNLMYIIAVSSWNAQDWPRSFVACLEFIKNNLDDPRADQLCLYAIQAARRIRPSRKPLPSASMMELYDLAEAHFDHLPQVRQVSWYRAHLLLETGRFAQAERLLRELPESSPMFWEAQYGLAMAALQLSVTDDQETAGRYLESASTALDSFVAAMPDPVPADKMPVVRAMIGLAMGTARGWLSQTPPYQQRALAILDKIGTLDISRSHVQRAEEALRLQIDVLNSDASQSLDLLDGALAADAIHPEIAATLSSLADHFEKQYLQMAAGGEQSVADQLGETLTALYVRLLDFHARRPSGLEQPIEIALRRRLGAILIRRGRADEALPNYLWLLQHVSRSQSADVLRGLAVAYEETDAFEDALATWRQLKDGLPHGNDDWIEARYHVAHCHAALGNPELAGRSLKLLLLQAPAALQGQWSAQIRDLQRQIESAVAQRETAGDDQADDFPGTGAQEVPKSVDAPERDGR